MPKPVHELIAKQRPHRERVLKFLQADPTNAFTPVEIAATIDASSPRMADLIEMALLMTPQEQRAQTLAPWMAALAELVQSGDVTSFDDGGSVYYAYAGAR